MPCFVNFFIKKLTKMVLLLLAKKNGFFFFYPPLCDIATLPSGKLTKSENLETADHFAIV